MYFFLVVSVNCMHAYVSVYVGEIEENKRNTKEQMRLREHNNETRRKTHKHSTYTKSICMHEERENSLNKTRTNKKNKEEGL